MTQIEARQRIWMYDKDGLLVKVSVSGITCLGDFLSVAQCSFCKLRTGHIKWTQTRKLLFMTIQGKSRVS